MLLLYYCHYLTGNNDNNIVVAKVLEVIPEQPKEEPKIEKPVNKEIVTKEKPIKRIKKSKK